MIEILFVPLALIYFAVIGLLFIYGINFFYLTFLAGRAQSNDPIPPMPVPLPRVTVQLPIYNELYVAERLIHAVARLDYPAELLEIQVLDDSSDETVEIVRAAVERWRANGVHIAQVRRADRQGFKAGALANGMQSARGEFIAIFDADFIPSPDFLKRTLPHLTNPRIAFVQTRWGHVNRDYSLLTRLQSLAIDAHFMIEQFARSHSDYWFNFNGTAGIWRRTAMEDAGGWTADTLTEDLDLSYRAFLRGWQAVFLRDVEVLAELPVTLSAYRRQQHRWGRGSLECAIKLLPRVWQSSAPWQKKLEATLHLTGYGIHLLMFVLMLLYPAIILMSARYPGLGLLFGIALICNATAFAPTIFFLVAQQQLNRIQWRELAPILFITMLGTGMMINTTRAALEIVFRPRAAFERTPKFGIARKNQNWRALHYQLRLDSIVYVEIVFALFNGWSGLLALQANNFAVAFYAFLFAAGMFFTSGATIAQTFAVQRQQNLDQRRADASMASLESG